MSARRRRTKSGSKEEEEKQLLSTGFGYPVTSNRDTFIENTAKDYHSETLDMSFRDRTGEFLSAVKSLQSRQVIGKFA